MYRDCLAKAVLILANDLYQQHPYFCSRVFEWFGLFVWFSHLLAGLRTSSTNPPCSLTPAQAYAARWDLSPVPRSTVIVPRREASLDTPSNRTNSVSNANNHNLQPNQTSKQQQRCTTEQQSPSARLRTKTFSLDCGLEPALCPKSGILLPPSTVPSTAPPCTMPPTMPNPTINSLLDPLNPPNKLSTNPRPPCSTAGL